MKETMTGTEITQSFYNNMASQYDKLFLDWQRTTQEQGAFLHEIFRRTDLTRQRESLTAPVASGPRPLAWLCWAMT